MKLRLFNYFRSSASWRVRIALALKGLDYEYVPVNLVAGGGEQLGAAYAGINPMREVPSLEVDGVIIAQSLAIIEFLEETHPAPPLLPGDAFQRAQIRRLAENVNASIAPLQNLRVLKKIDADFTVGEEGKKTWAAHWIHQGFIGLETLLNQTAGRYAVGEAVTLADVCLVPQVFNAERFGVDLGAFPKITAVRDALAALPAFSATHPHRQPDCPEALRV